MRIEHTGIVVKNLDKEVAFYRDVIGLRILREAEVSAPSGGDHTGLDGVRRKLVFLGDDRGEPQVELIYYIQPASPGANPAERHQINSAHLCFTTENLLGSYQDLLDRGVRFLTPPKLIDRPEQGNRVCLCYAQDPEGNWIEFKDDLVIK